MLLVCFVNGDDAVWHVGEQCPIDRRIDYLYKSSTIGEKEQGVLAHLTLETVYLIQADGDELNHILNQYTIASHGENALSITVPFPVGKKVVRWYGDIARTILLNL
jgi:hypothetical protein